MFRAIFLAVGVGLFMLGLESLAVDHAVLAEDSLLARKVKPAAVEPVFDDYGFQVGERTVQAPVTRNVSPPEWAPWSMLSSGSVILLYSLAARFGGASDE